MTDKKLELPSMEEYIKAHPEKDPVAAWETAWDAAHPAEELIEDDGIDLWAIEPLGTPGKDDGWFPHRMLSLLGGGCGTGKTYWMMTLLEAVRVGADFLGHKTVKQDYRVLMIDRGAGDMRRTLTALGLGAEAKKRCIAISAAQQARQPAEVLEELIVANPGVKIWYIEGLDFWFSDVLVMKVVGPILDGLQRTATKHSVIVVGSVGAPKEKSAKGKDTPHYHGRDALFGSAALARKASAVVIISKTDEDDGNAPRHYVVLKRNGPEEHFWMGCRDGVLYRMERPADPEEFDGHGAHSKAGLIRMNIGAHFKPGERVVYPPLLGCSRQTFRDWLIMEAASPGGLVEDRGGVYLVREKTTTAKAMKQLAHSSRRFNARRLYPFVLSLYSGSMEVFYVFYGSHSSCSVPYAQVANPFAAVGAHVGSLRSLRGWREPFPLRDPGFLGRPSRAHVHANRLAFRHSGWPHGLDQVFRCESRILYGRQRPDGLPEYCCGTGRYSHLCPNYPSH